jgi:hypothetical protein
LAKAPLIGATSRVKAVVAIRRRFIGFPFL